MYDSILSRSFSRHEQKKLGYGAFICCLFVVFCFCTLLKPYWGPLPALNLQVSMGTIGLKMLALKETNISHQIFGGKQNLGLITSTKVSENVSLQKENSTSYSQHYDSGRSIEESKNVSLGTGNSTSEKNDWELSTKESKNVSLDIGNSTSEQNDLELSTNGSKNVSLQVENSTSPDYKDTPTIPLSSIGQHAETAVQENVTKKKTLQPLCSTGQERTEFCEIKMDVRIDGNSGSVFVVSSQSEKTENNNSWIIRPYARKEDLTAMSHVRKWSVKAVEDNQEIPKCTINHNVPAVLFSSGGYVGNNFHEFTDVLIPLFITSRQYNGEVQFLISDKRSWFIPKFQKILEGLSKYEIIDIDKEKQVHCFPSATIGLKRHPKEMAIDPSKHLYSMRDFRDFLRHSYSLKKSKAIRIKDGKRRKKPRLLILSRRRTRAFTNVDEIVKMARSLGYKVIVSEADRSLSKFAELMNSCDVLMGVHGAGLTNMVFLPENAVFIQVLPLGEYQWLAKTYFGEPSKDMNLKYLEYEIAREESTLINQYPLDHAVFTDPISIGKQGWEAFKSIFLEKQNVNLDVNRFKPVLLKALELLHQ
ncbi:beta-1,2-xylosyltransferase XYXT1 [Ziziphus jujuba]|uniref:Beta-1,2-xylosyltransferase XYXT1 n=1 Tax=Ziziphus jujuba TaxID=326968 RepID=A0ABM4A1U7_ZIZJJ|nr:beta-1,2-xylosyltransferase XYXT1 [Ziziphus jujuba]